MIQAVTCVIVEDYLCVKNRKRGKNTLNYVGKRGVFVKNSIGKRGKLYYNIDICTEKSKIR